MGMHNPPHPGEILKEMWIKPLSLTVTRAAAELKVSPKTLSEILNGRAAATPEMAVRVELAFGKSAESWLGHQAAHDLWAIQIKKASMGIQRVGGSSEP